MRGKKIAMNFAHMPGACGVAVSPDGLYALTSGVDCAVRAHDIRAEFDPWFLQHDPSEPDPEDVPASDLHDKPVSAVALVPDGKTFATASDDGFVRIFSAAVAVDEGAPLTVQSRLVQACARFGGPVRALDFSPTGAFLAAAGDEPGVLKVIMSAQPSNVNVLRASLREGQSPILSLAFDPKTDFIISIGENGCAGVWCVESGTFAGPLAINDRQARCVAWAPDGSRLIVGTDKGAVLVRRETWTFASLLQDDDGDEDEDDNDNNNNHTPRNGITAVSWSKSGRYVVTARDDSTVRVWDVDNSKILASWKTEEPVQLVRWHPSTNAFMVLDRIGQWGVVGDVVPAHMPASYHAEATVELPCIAPDVDDESKLLDDEDRDQSESGTEQLPEFNFDVDDLEADDEDDAIEMRKKRDSLHSEDENSNSSGSDADDDSRATVRRSRRSAHRRRASSGRSAGAVVPRAVVSAQQSFMPSATPGSESGRQAQANATRRILCWTLTATIVSFDENTHNTVEIEFADASKRNIGIKDHFGFTLGCISDSGVLLACPKAKDHSSVVLFRPFSSWSSNSDWTRFLATDESATCICLGARFAAVATSMPRNLVRVFSLSGIETDVFGIPGRVVTMTSSKNRIGLVYSSSPVTPDLRYEILEVSNYGEVTATLAKDCLVISPDSKLEWFGFTNDTCELAAYDSTGCLWLHAYGRGGLRWIPMLQDAAKFAECDWFWIAAVTSENAIGVSCLSNERYPPAKPRPALRSVAFVAPVVEAVSKSGQYSVVERLYRTRQKLTRAVAAHAAACEIYESDDDEVAEAEEVTLKFELETDKCLLSLMEEACRLEQNLRAFDYATRLKCEASYKFAADIANHYKRTALAGRVEELARRRLASIQTIPEPISSPKSPQRMSPITPGPGKAESAAGEVRDSDDETDGDEAVNKLCLGRQAKVSNRSDVVGQTDAREANKRPSVFSSNRFQKKVKK
jgi:chromosome transmission fidelity protein 4